MSKKTTPGITYYDLKIPVPDHMTKMTQAAVNEFEDHHDYIVLSPKLKNKVLKVNSTDFIALLGYLEVSNFSEMDLKRIQSEAESQMQQYVAKTVNADYRSHYQWCLAALKNLDWGRHKTGS